MRVICAVLHCSELCAANTAINLLPCTDNVDNKKMAPARLILEDATSPGYTLQKLHPVVQTRRNLHRGIGIFSRNDNYYDYGCEYITDVR